MEKGRKRNKEGRNLHFVERGILQGLAHFTLQGKRYWGSEAEFKKGVIRPGKVEIGESVEEPDRNCYLFAGSLWIFCFRKLGLHELVFYFQGLFCFL